MGPILLLNRDGAENALIAGVPAGFGAGASAVTDVAALCHALGFCEGAATETAIIRECEIGSESLGEARLALLEGAAAIDGLELTDAARRVRPGLRQLLTSARLPQGCGLEDHLAPQDGFLARPYQPTALVLAVQRVFGRSEGQGAALDPPRGGPPLDPVMHGIPG